MLGLGISLSNAALMGAGGGGGGFNPSQLTLLGAYEMFDRSSTFQGYRNLKANTGTYVPLSKTKVDTTPLGTIMDKSQLPGWDGTQTFQEWLDATTPDVDHDFSSDPGYTLGAGWAITGGNLVATAANSLATYNFGAEDNTYYYYELTFGSYTSGNVGVDFGGNTGTINVSGAASTTYQGVIWSGASGNGNVEITPVSGNYEIASIKVWKTPGNHVFATGNDRGTAQTDGNAITYLNTLNGDWFIGDELVTIAGTNISGLAMFDPNDTGVMSAYGGIAHIGLNATAEDSILFSNQTGGGSFTPNLYIDDGANTEDLYTRGSANVALQLAEWNVNGGTSYQVWEDGSSVGSGTPTYTVDMTGQSNNISIGTTVEGNDSLDAYGALYAVYFYEGDRSADLYTYVNTNTGENF